MWSFLLTCQFFVNPIVSEESQKLKKKSFGIPGSKVDF